jgi:hypothetical protein
MPPFLTFLWQKSGGKTSMASQSCSARGLQLAAINKFPQIAHFKLARCASLCLNGTRERET